MMLGHFWFTAEGFCNGPNEMLPKKPVPMGDGAP